MYKSSSIESEEKFGSSEGKLPTLKIQTSLLIMWQLSIFLTHRATQRKARWFIFYETRVHIRENAMAKKVIYQKLRCAKMVGHTPTKMEDWDYRHIEQMLQLRIGFHR